MDDKKHAKYSPSNMGMFEKCPGYRNKNEKTEASLRGDRIHDALEKDDLGKLEDENEKIIAQQCKDYIDSIISERLPQLPDTDVREATVHIDLGNERSTFGTFDRLLIYGNHGWMFDYKTGYREVADAEHNAQGWSYAIGLFQSYPILNEITVVFMIPNRDELSTHTFTRADLPRMKLRINTIFNRAQELESLDFFSAHPERLNPQPELCEYCSRQTVCPALAAKHLHIAQDLGKGLPVPKNLRVSKERPEDIPHLLRLAPLIEAWAGKIRADALRVNLEEGVEIKGFNRFERQLPRAAKTVLGTWDVVKDRVNLEDFLMLCGQVSIKQLEDLIAEKAKHGNKGKARDELMDELRGADVLLEKGKIFYLREDKK